MNDILIIDYTNYKGERRVRCVKPHSIRFGISWFHGSKQQWFMCAMDMEKGEVRDFALKDIHSMHMFPPVAGDLHFAEVWHEGSKSFHKALLLHKIDSPSDANHPY